MPTSVEIGPMVDLLEREWGAVDALCAPLTEEQYATPTCLPGWTVKDQLAHVIGTEAMLDGVPAPEVDVSHLEHLRNDIARMGEVWVEEMRPWSGAEVLARFREVTARRRASLAAMGQAEFDAPSWTPVGADETYGRFMRIRLYDTYMHEHDMRDALGLPERPDPATIEQALAEIEPALGYIVGRRAAMPDGSRVRIELTGPVTRTYLIEVAGRATAVDELDGPPTVGIELPTMLFLRLTGGRLDAPTRIGADLTLQGDPVLARQLASNLTFTI